MVALTSDAPKRGEAKGSGPSQSPSLGHILNQLYREQLALRPDDPYLAEHATERNIANQVRTFEWYLPFLPCRGAVLEWGCNHAPDSCLLRATLANALDLHGCDFREPDQYRVMYDFAGLAYTRLSHVVMLPYGADMFDAVIASGTLEHVAMDYESLKEIYRVLKPDGTLILTSPAGQTYITTPGSALLFPSLCRPVGGMPAPEAELPPDYCAERNAMMPKRRRTRAQNRAQRVAAERRANRDARTACNAARLSDSGPAPPDYVEDPPPF